MLDEWLLDRPDELFRGFLLELMEARYGAPLHRLLHAVPPEGLAPRGLGAACTPTP